MKVVETPTGDVLPAARMLSMDAATGCDLWDGVVFDAMDVNIYLLDRPDLQKLLDNLTGE